MSELTLYGAQCGCNFELEDIPISNELKSELMEWGTQYGEWMIGIQKIDSQWY